MTFTKEWFEMHEHPMLGRHQPENAKIKIGLIHTKNIDFSPTFSLGYVISAVLGDGTLCCCKIRSKYNVLRYRYDIRLIVKDEDFRDFYVARLKEIGSACWKGIKKGKHGGSDLLMANTTSHALFNFIKEFKFNFTSIEMKRGFLRGIFDAEGGAYAFKKKKSINISLTNKNIELLQEIKKLLLEFGIESKIYNHGGSGFKPDEMYYRLIFTKNEYIKKFYQNIGFSIKRKNVGGFN